MQANILFHIRQSYGDRFDALPELTFRLRETKFYVPDIAVEELARPVQGRYLSPGDPVFLCIEVKSPEDRIGKLFSKCEEYHAWGVSHCWVIDPAASGRLGIYPRGRGASEGGCGFERWSDRNSAG